MTNLLVENLELKFDQKTMIEKREESVKEFKKFGGYEKLIDSRS